MIQLLLAAFLCLAAIVPALGQAAPFEMQPGAPRQVPAAPPRPPAEPRANEAEPAAPARPQPAARAEAADFRRYLVPAPELVMAGEMDRRSWSVHLTQEQSASPAVLQIGYQNAIVVAPELSTLRVLVNDVPVVAQAVNSSDAVRNIRAQVPSGLLRAGSNVVTIETELRHRTDCTIESTYELWVDVEPSQSFLAFEGPDIGTPRRLDDVASIGVDRNGATEFVVVAPAIDLAANASSVLRLSEGLALLANMPNQSVKISSTVPETSDLSGRMVVLIGTPAELSPLIDALPPGASTSPVAAFVHQPRLGVSAFVVSGPTWNAIGSVIETIVAPLDRPLTTPRAVLATGSWRFPDPLLFIAAGRASLGELGIRTQEFSGRRFRTDFAIGIPSDFYADAYGEATLLLDAAYSSDVRPGSHIDIYVNGNIASTVPITQEGGGLLSHLPVSVTMRHFRPGPNIITMEAVILTAADSVCAAGATGLTAPRFALFETSEFRMPDFARISRRPNLSGIAGTGFPYGRAVTPVPIVVERGSMDVLSGAATLLARLSVAAGRPIPVDLSVSPAAAANRDAIFVGTAANMQPQLLSQLGLSEQSRTEWTDTDAPSVSGNAAQTSQVLDRWRRDLSGEGWRGRLEALEDWVNQRFDVLPGSFRLVPREASLYMPGEDVTLLMAQQANPAGNGTWTGVLAPTGAGLADGMRSLATQEAWVRIAGRITTYSAGSKSVGNLEVGNFSFVPTAQPSFTNYRLIAANWLSANVLSYAVALVAVCIVLGIATSALLSVFGRRR